MMRQVILYVDQVNHKAIVNLDMAIVSIMAIHTIKAIHTTMPVAINNTIVTSLVVLNTIIDITTDQEVAIEASTILRISYCTYLNFIYIFYLQIITSNKIFN